MGFLDGLLLALSPEYRGYFIGRVLFHVVELGGVVGGVWLVYWAVNRLTDTKGLGVDEEKPEEEV